MSLQREQLRRTAFGLQELADPSVTSPGKLISILLPDLGGGGAERVSIDLARALANKGYQIEFVLMTAVGDFLNDAEQDFRIVELGVRKTKMAFIPIARYLRQRRPDAVIVNMWPLTSATVLGRFFSRYKCPILIVEHNVLSQQYSSWGWMHNALMRASMTATYRWAEHVAAVSEGSAKDTARLSGLPTERLSVLHNPIPQRSRPSPEAMTRAEALWACAAGERVLTVGALKDQKNQALLLRAFARLGSSDARIMLLGKGNTEPYLRALAKELGIADRVIFAGFHADPSPFYSTADLFVLSSDYEGLPTVLIEALSFGLPVVSTDCPSGPAEILENGRWGRLVPMGDAKALASAMEEALAAPVDRAALKRRAADFSPEIAARRYLALLGLA